MPKWKAKNFQAVTMWHENTQEGFDFIRIQTLYLLSQQILSKNVNGAIAECGVFKGEFARIINRFFKDRQFYLFDTFEGFSPSDIKCEFGSTDFFNKGFKNTNANAVLESMPYKENCIIKQGYFPGTFDLDDEKFAFVSLDMDLYKPMKDALEIFYPRLSQGGYIMAHDYHNKVFSGTKEAIDEFSKKHNVTIIPIADLFGSVIIAK
ncbi:TylF/MycF/NovP-related O-methyltransferase [Helicobacter ibis]|uniref:Class I SAM-dependent methyltransferase n=1 Tax=Helicobacter ibis TaxID=2962633 RepID=A0ABT4VFE9_9HELI|nr:TylF/MycF/NovP-related O-methyltransferase [Helicobacter ibis]MDA3969440.1 class I SAM-dependent methyltransferase [Helicobacter ibis]